MENGRQGEQETSAEKEPGGDKWPLEGYFSCGSGLLVVPECLGQSFQTRTATYELTITLPELDASDASAPLRRPPWKFNREGVAPTASVDEEWGTLASVRKMNSDGTWPAYNAEVRQCVVATTVDARDDEQFREAAKAVGAELAVWWASVTDWLGVLTVQDFVGLGTRQRSILSDGFRAWSGDARGIRRASCGSVLFVVPGAVEALDWDQVQRAMDLAASGQRPPAEWLFIRDARSLLRAGEYRRAVIDAGTATELTLTALLDRHFSATSTGAAISEALLDRSQTLRGRCKLVNELIPGTVPARFQQEVTEPRNLAAHAGNMLTRQTGEAAVAKATELVEVAFPRAGFV